MVQLMALVGVAEGGAQEASSMVAKVARTRMVEWISLVFMYLMWLQ